MKIILLQDVKKLGKKGDIIEANDGYARNYLIPKKLGAEASGKNINDLKLQKKNDEKIAAEKLADAKALAEKLSGISIDAPIKVGENGKTFGSVSSKEISELLEKQKNIKVDKKKISVKEPIKTLGTYVVQVKLHPEVVADLKVNVKEG